MDRVGRFIEQLYDMDIPALTCECGHVHWTRPYQTPIDTVVESDLTTRLQQNKAMKDDVKKVRSKFRAASAAARAFITALKKEHEHFMNGAQIHINALKTLQEESRTRLKLTVEYLEARKTAASATSTLGVFKRRYNSGWREIRILFPRTSPYRRRRYRGVGTPAQQIVWKFKLRI